MENRDQLVQMLCSNNISDCKIACEILKGKVLEISLEEWHKIYEAPSSRLTQPYESSLVCSVRIKITQDKHSREIYYQS